MSEKNGNAISGEVQVLRQFFPDAYIAIVIDKKLTVDDAIFVKKSGCNFVLSENDFLNTIRIDYIILNVVKASLIPIKASDIKPGTVVDFSVYTIMTLNKKIMPVLHPGSEVSDSKYQKMTSLGEIYIRRHDIDAFSKYLNTHTDKSASGLLSRCRAQFLNVTYNHFLLISHILDYSEQSSFQRGKSLIEKCNQLSSEFVFTLGSTPDPWKVIDQSTYGTLGSVDRSMMVASMAGLTAFISGTGDYDSIMMCGLFCDVATLDLSPKTIGLLDSKEGREALDPEDKAKFLAHPSMSLNLILERRFQFTDAQKDIILCSHEQADKKGFPKMLPGNKIPFEASMILFHELVDLEYRVKMGKTRRPYPEVFKEVFQQESAKLDKFTLLFLEKIRPFLQSLG
ncbi:MAG: hypothetical protein ACOYOK_12060 [Pseudobdellovibrionaceae bacterium]